MFIYGINWRCAISDLSSMYQLQVVDGEELIDVNLNETLQGCTLILSQLYQED